MIELETIDYQKPVAGQTFTNQMGKFPFDRPPEHTDPAEALAVIFERLSSPKTASKTLNAMESGVPVDLIVSTVGKSMIGEGFAHPATVTQMIPSITVMFMRMADAADIKPILSSDFAGEEGVRIDESDLDIERLKQRGGLSNNKINKATDALESSTEELSNLSTGLVARPEGVV